MFNAATELFACCPRDLLSRSKDDVVLVLVLLLEPIKASISSEGVQPPGSMDWRSATCKDGSCRVFALEESAAARSC